MVALAAGLVSCSADSTATTRPVAPTAVPVINVTMSDHRFVLDRNPPPGRVVFRIRNAGEAPHHLIMFPMPEDLPPIAEQLGGFQRRYVEPFAGIYDRAPGDIGTFAVDLVAGRRYAMVCSVMAADGEPHWKKGMATEFRSTTPSAPSTGPSSPNASSK